MGQNADTLRQGYEAFNQGDAETALGLLADDVRWEGPNFDRLPGGGVFEGKEAVGRMWGSLAEAYDGFRSVPDEFIEQDDTVVVLGHAEATVRKTGNSLKVPFAHVWRMREGRAERIQILTDTATTAQAHGML